MLFFFNARIVSASSSGLSSTINIILSSISISSHCNVNLCAGANVHLHVCKYPLNKLYTLSCLPGLVIERKNAITLLQPAWWQICHKNRGGGCQPNEAGHKLPPVML